MDSFGRKGIEGKRIRDAIETILIACGQAKQRYPEGTTSPPAGDQEWKSLELRDGIRETPERVANSMADMLSGYDEDPAEILKSFEEQEGIENQLIMMRNIEFYSQCEHHILPFAGLAHIGYIPASNRFIGASKFARLLDIYAQRLQIQERLGAEIANAIMIHMEPRPIGVGVIIEAGHFCMRMRGVKKQRSEMVNNVFRGVFLQKDVFGLAARNEFLMSAYGRSNISL